MLICLQCRDKLVTVSGRNYAWATKWAVCEVCGNARCCKDIPKEQHWAWKKKKEEPSR